MKRIALVAAVVGVVLMAFAAYQVQAGVSDTHTGVLMLATGPATDGQRTARLRVKDVRTLSWPCTGC